MNSLDTNILLYAINSDCPEHPVCLQLVQKALEDPEAWIIADQVWFELYRLLRNPRVLTQALGAEEAAHTIQWYRNRSGWLHCAWEPDMMPLLNRLWKRKSLPARNSFDAVLAVTLNRHGVQNFYTRNTRDFEPFTMFTLFNPIDG